MAQGLGLANLLDGHLAHVSCCSRCCLACSFLVAMGFGVLVREKEKERKKEKQIKSKPNTQTQTRGEEKREREKEKEDGEGGRDAPPETTSKQPTEQARNPKPATVFATTVISLLSSAMSRRHIHDTCASRCPSPSSSSSFLPLSCGTSNAPEKLTGRLVCAFRPSACSSVDMAHEGPRSEHHGALRPRPHLRRLQQLSVCLRRLCQGQQKDWRRLQVLSCQ